MNLNLLLGVAGILMLFCVFANRLSDRYGIPALLLFLGLGMLAGSDGVGQIQFYDAKLSNHIGTVALIFILFTGGLETRWSEVRPAIFRGTLLSTAGVALTALFLYLCTRYILRIPHDIAMLLSVIVSSTDAPAVFSILRTQKGELKSDLKPRLEFESGSNDPMAILLSMGVIEILSAPVFNGSRLAVDFILQMFLGVAFGIILGKAAIYVLSKLKLAYIGLYPVFGVGLVMVTFSITQIAYGNGFLAVYLCGIILGNSGFMYRRHLLRFHDSLGWIMQIGMFLILGLLVNPSDLGSVFLPSFGCSVFLVFIARPLAVFICLYKSKYTLNEKIFISWAGLKGAVPIILATYPLMINFPNSQFLFNTIFFMVILSVLGQGQTLPLLAKKLKLYKR